MRLSTEARASCSWVSQARLQVLQAWVQFSWALAGHHGAPSPQSRRVSCSRHVRQRHDYILSQKQIVLIVNRNYVVIIWLPL